MKNKINRSELIKMKEVDRPDDNYFECSKCKQKHTVAFYCCKGGHFIEFVEWTKVISKKEVINDTDERYNCI